MLKKFEMTPAIREFIHTQARCERPDFGNIFCAPISAELAFQCVCDAILGPDLYAVDPLGAGQIRTLQLDDILLKLYGRRYVNAAKKGAKMSHKIALCSLYV